MSELKPCPFKGKFIIEVETSFETQETSDSVAYMLQEDFNESKVANMSVWGVDKVVPFDQDALRAENERLRADNARMREALEAIEMHTNEYIDKGANYPEYLDEIIKTIKTLKGGE